MDIIEKTIYYIEYDEVTEEEIEKSFSYKAKLDMKCIKLIQRQLKENEIDLKIHEIFNKVSELNMEVIAIIVIQSIKRCSDVTEEEIMKVMEFQYAIELINKLIEVSMPLKNSLSIQNLDDEFEDDEDEIEDWDFDYMTYLWYSVLKRSDDFYEITPKYFFNQMEVHKKFNGINENQEKIEYI